MKTTNHPLPAATGRFSAAWLAAISVLSGLLCLLLESGAFAVSFGRHDGSVPLSAALAILGAALLSIGAAITAFLASRRTNPAQPYRKSALTVLALVAAYFSLGPIGGLIYIAQAWQNGLVR